MNVSLVSKTIPDAAFFDQQLRAIGLEPQDEYSGEELTIQIARVSSSRSNKLEDIGGLLNYLIKNSHWSPFEHVYMTVEIETSRAIGRQLLRHRSFTFQEFSQRYAKVNEIEDIEIRLQAEKNRQSSTEHVATIFSGAEGTQSTGESFNWTVIDSKWWEDREEITELDNALNSAVDALQATQDAYNQMLDAGVAKECARNILPVGSQTTIYMTGNMRSWIHFLDLRDDEHSQKEAQVIGREIKMLFTKNFPLVAEALGYDEKYFNQVSERGVVRGKCNPDNGMFYPCLNEHERAGYDFRYAEYLDGSIEIESVVMKQSGNDIIEDLSEYDIEDIKEIVEGKGHFF